MRDLKISTRLVGAFALLVLIILAVSVVAGTRLAAMRASSQAITGEHMPSVELANMLNTGLVRARLYEVRHVNHSDAQYMAGVERDMQALQVELADVKKRYQALLSAAEEKTLFDRFEAVRGEYLKIEHELFKLSRDGRKEEAQALLGGRSIQLFNESSDLLKQIIAYNRQAALAETQAAEATYSESILLLSVAAVIALLVATGAGFWLVSSIRKPLQRAVDMAERVAQGDLSHRIEVTSRDEVGMLLAALQKMQASLANTVSVVRTTAESVASASAQIASGNSDLSGRTEEQASALEETAASMEELGSTVRQNADNARQANQLAISACGVAEQGGAVVAEVVNTMQGIHASSQKIADIIGVIDGIAFQTNILALNAAVEAARAGEQGRGFAVVAGEVRNLAQRSAEAAKEIKALITASVERVGEGTQLVDKAGVTMSEVVTAVRRVTDIMGEISAASAEQSSGVEQVGQAVSQMDQATQQNAALVEEMAAAAGSLKHQAAQLVSAVAVFQISQEAQAAHRAAPPVVQPQPAPVRAAAGAASRRVAPAARVAATAKPHRAQPLSIERAPRPETATATDEWEAF